VRLDGLLALFDGSVEIARPHLHCSLIAREVQGNQLGIVVFIAILLLLAAFLIGLMTIEVGVITCLETLYITSERRILLVRTRHKQQKRHSTEQYVSQMFQGKMFVVSILLYNEDAPYLLSTS
jgi:hypothetical protein